MPISTAKLAAGRTPGAVIALHLLSVAWAVVAIALGAASWRSSDGLTDATVADNVPAVTVTALCAFAATITFGLGLIVGQLAKRES